MVQQHPLRPFSLGLDLLQSMEQAFLPGPAGRSTPRITGRIEGDSLQVRAEAPGFGPEDLELELEGQALALRFLGEPDEEGVREPLHATRLRLPFRVDPDTVEATLRHGLLEVILHRWQAEKTRIQVQSAE